MTPEEYYISMFKFENGPKPGEKVLNIDNVLSYSAPSGVWRKVLEKLNKELGRNE